MRAFFEAVHRDGIGRIAVDVRANGGGNSSVVNEFLRYLPVDSYASYTGGVRVSAESVRQRGSDGLDMGYHEFPANPRANTDVDGLPPFEGEVFLLTSKGTFSSGNWFAVLFKDNGLGLLVGEPTGNAPSSYGDALSFTLPETSFSFGMSYKRWIRPDRALGPADQVVPDVLVPLTRADVLAGRDPVLDYLRAR